MSAPRIISVSTDAQVTSSWLHGPTSIGQLLIGLLICWTVIAAAVGILALFALVPGLVLGGIAVVSTTVIAYQAVDLMRAKREALTRKEVPILWGLGRLVAWDPVEGVLFLRNKQLSFVDDSLQDCQGGLRCIYPVLGDELALRVPLETQTLEFADNEVLTQEYLSVTIRGSMRWQITDLRAFYLNVSRELRSTGELSDSRQQATLRAAPSGAPALEQTTGTKLMTAAIEWLRLLAEERTRTVVSRVSSGLLIAERMSDSLGSTTDPHGALRLSSIPAAVDGTQEPWKSATDTLAHKIAETVADGIANSGVAITRVSLQEIRLPAGIVQACIEAAQAAYLPLLAQRQAATKRADLATEVDLLGKEAVGAREVVGAAPAYTLADFLTQFVSKQLSGGPAGIASAGLLAAAAGQGSDRSAGVPMTREPS